jgi:hypothetical protein
VYKQSSAGAPFWASHTHKGDWLLNNSLKEQANGVLESLPTSFKEPIASDEMGTEAEFSRGNVFRGLRVRGKMTVQSST